MWHKVIPEICNAIDKLGVKYHADASSSLFVNGFDFDMDDFDLTVEWGSIEKVRRTFKHFNPTTIAGANPKQFKFQFRGHKIEVMSYESASGIGPDSERELVHFAGADIWTKKSSFYLSRMRKDHPIRDAAIKHFS